METMLTTEYDGCGMCLVGTRRLSRTTDATSSPERQAIQSIDAVAEAGGHIIAWADDWQVSGATDPLTRKGLGPWLQGIKGPYDGVASASVDRIGRNLRDVLNTQDMLTKQGRMIVTADHQGIWDFNDPNDENEWTIKAWGSRSNSAASRSATGMRPQGLGQPVSPSSSPATGTCTSGWSPWGKLITLRSTLLPPRSFATSPKGS
ncbi:recombinase family protein [Streptacidiphilus sp. 4-A2]|nr:recombinase family protein [Streptacidiphilus sp. 4-A2]